MPDKEERCRFHQVNARKPGSISKLYLFFEDNVCFPECMNPFPGPSPKLFVKNPLQYCGVVKRADTETVSFSKVWDSKVNFHTAIGCVFIPD